MIMKNEKIKDKVPEKEAEINKQRDCRNESEYPLYSNNCRQKTIIPLS